MADTDVEFIGKELGQHGSNIYFRAFSVRVANTVKSYKLGQFYVVRRNPSQPICIAEFQLIWKNIKDGRKLASAKLYFRPEDTPYGRRSEHGHDELLEADRHVAIYCVQMPRWECEPQQWETGQFAYETVDPDQRLQFFSDTTASAEDYSTPSNDQPRCTKSVKILSYPGYCRYRTCVKILQTKHSLPKRMLLAKGALELSNQDIRILFSRTKFSHPSIEDNVFTGDLKLPVFKGRPRKRKPTPLPPTINGKRVKAIRLDYGQLAADRLLMTEAGLQAKRLDINTIKAPLIGAIQTSIEFEQNPDRFLEEVQSFMKQIGSPITKIPKVAFTRVSLFKLFELVNSYGGYAQVTMNHKWKRVYDALGLATTITSAATCIRRHYERLLLPYEKFLRHRHKMLKEQAIKQQGLAAGLLINNRPSPSGSETNASQLTQSSDTIDLHKGAQNGEAETGQGNKKKPIPPLKPKTPASPGCMSAPLPNTLLGRSNPVPTVLKREGDVNREVTSRGTGPLSNNNEDNDVPSLPLKLVIQRRRGRPPKYLKAQLEELKSLAQKARIGQLCAQRTSKRGRKPKSTVLRISVGPDGTIRSDLGNIQLTPEQMKENAICNDKANRETNRQQQKSVHDQSIQTPRLIDMKEDALHSQNLKRKEPHLIKNRNSAEGTPLFNGYKQSQHKCRLDALLPKIEQNYLCKKAGTLDGAAGVEAAPLPKYQVVSECSRVPDDDHESKHYAQCHDHESSRKLSPSLGMENKATVPIVCSRLNLLHNAPSGVKPLLSNKLPAGSSVPLSESMSVASDTKPIIKVPISGQRASVSVGCQKSGPPPLVPIENSDASAKTSSAGSVGNIKVKQEPYDSVAASCPSRIPNAISLASVVPGLNIVTKPFDVESLMKPLTRHIDQSLQTIKETVDAKISGVVYIGDEDHNTCVKSVKNEESGNLFKSDSNCMNSYESSCTKNSQLRKDSIILKDRGHFSPQTQVLFIPKGQEKGLVIQGPASFVTPSGIKVEKDIGKALHYAAEPSPNSSASPCVHSSYLHSNHYSSHHPLHIENNVHCPRSSKLHSQPLTANIGVSSHRCSCSSNHVSNSQTHHQHHHHHNRHHHHHHTPYYHRHQRHYHSSDGKVTTASKAQMDALLRKVQNPAHRCSNVTTNGSNKLVEYHQIEH